MTDGPGLELVEAAAVADAFGADAVRLGGGAVCAVAPRLEEVTINRVIGLGIRQHFASLSFRLAVNHLGLSRSFRVLDGSFLSRCCLQLALLNLLFF